MFPAVPVQTATEQLFAPCPAVSGRFYICNTPPGDFCFISEFSYMGIIPYLVERNGVDVLNLNYFILEFIQMQRENCMRME